MNKTVFLFLPLFYCQLLCLSDSRVHNRRRLVCIFQDYFKFLTLVSAIFCYLYVAYI
jgi:hypothetical protein